MRRLFWAALGVGLGAAVGVSATRWLRRTADAMTPASVGERFLDRAQDLAERLGDAWAAGRSAMAEREAELRARYVEPASEVS